MFRTTSLRVIAFTLSAALGALALPAGADDIDIFLGTSAGSNGNPRILIVLDNTSNWARQNQKWPGGISQGQSEANAVKRVLTDLNGTVSLGLMEFVTGGNATQDGGFIRYPILPMNTANKAAFATELTEIYNNINSPDEKRNSNTPYGNLMYDVYNYFAGGNSYSPTAVLASKADSGGYTTNYTRFKTPLTLDNLCGKTYVIFIGNPNASGPASDSTNNTNLLKTLTDRRNASGVLQPVTQLQLPNFSSQKVSTPTNVGSTQACYATPAAAEAGMLVAPFPATCSGYTDGCTIGTALPNTNGVCTGTNRQYNVVGTDTYITNIETGTTSTDTGPRNADEWVRLMHDKGIPIGNGLQTNVTTYTIDVHNAQPNAEHTSLMLSMARAGHGKYFLAKNEQAIVDAIKNIIIEIQAVNTTFASTSLPVNATNRSQNENQVFIGMFRPDKDAKPRWFGNLKRYQLVEKGGNIELGDAIGDLAVNTNTGFVTPCATSWWTSHSVDYWENVTLDPAPIGTCDTSDYAAFPYSDAPDGPFVEKGGAAQILRQGNRPAGGTVSYAVSRTVLTQTTAGLVPLTTANSGLDNNLVRFLRGEDVNNEKPGGSSQNTRPSIHGDVIHSRPLPVNFGPLKGGVTVFYGANDGTFRALDAASGVERWAFMAPEFFDRLSRLQTNSPLVAYPNMVPQTITPTRKDYFFDGSTGIYQNADSSAVWIYPTMRRGGRMIYALDVSTPTAPVFKWKAGCPNLTNDTGCTPGMAAIGQTWSTPSVAFIKGYNTGTTPVLVVGGGYDRCEDADSASPNCTATKGNAIFVLDASSGAVLKSFPTTRAVAADIAMVDIDNDGKPDYAYAADTGGKLYRVDFVDSARAAREPEAWTMRTVASTAGGGRKFLFAPALLATTGHVYVAIGSGDREHPLNVQYPFTSVTNRFYVYKDDLSAAATTAAVDLDTLENYTANNSCDTPPVLPNSSLKGWFINLTANGTGEQVVTSALIAGGMVTFSTNRPIAAAAGTCSNLLGEARGYWLNLLNGSGAIGVAGTCGGERSSAFVGGGLPPSPVLATGVPILNAKGVPQATTVVIGAVQKNEGASVPIAPQRIRPAINSRRKRAYSYTSGAD